jgi:hypothetical protein
VKRINKNNSLAEEFKLNILHPPQGTGIEYIFPLYVVLEVVNLLIFTEEAQSYQPLPVS